MCWKAFVGLVHEVKQPSGTTYCFEEDRVSYTSPLGDWNQLLTVWIADVEHPTSFTSSQAYVLSHRRFQ